MLAYFTSSGIRHAVDPKVILCWFDFCQKPSFQVFQLHQVNLTFENGLLNALPGALAHLGNAPEPAAAGLCFCIYVVADDYQHVVSGSGTARMRPFPHEVYGRENGPAVAE